MNKYMKRIREDMVSSIEEVIEAESKKRSGVDRLLMLDRIEEVLAGKDSYWMDCNKKDLRKCLDAERTRIIKPIPTNHNRLVVAERENKVQIQVIKDVLKSSTANDELKVMDKYDKDSFLAGWNASVANIETAFFDDSEDPINSCSCQIAHNGDCYRSEDQDGVA